MEVKLSSDATDVDFHPDPTSSIFTTSLLSGKVQLFDYSQLSSTSTDTTDTVKRIESIRPSKKSIRACSFNPTGDSIWSTSKDGNLFRLDTSTFQIVHTWKGAHQAAPSRLLPIDNNLVVTGDDSGLINLWDQRIQSLGGSGTGANSSTIPMKSYSHHFDWITEMLWFDHLIPPKVKSIQELKEVEEKRKEKERSKNKNKKRKKSKEEREEDIKNQREQQKLEMKNRQMETGRSRLVCTSGDGSLSVIDLRGGSSSNTNETKNPGSKVKSGTPSGGVEVSEDQEDELLSMTSVKGGNKLVIGTQLGILSLWSPSRGLLDHVDRIPGHPSSVDSLCNLDQDTVLSGSSDGLLRVVQILPHKLLGVLHDNGGMPIERIKRKENWVASLGHRDVLTLNWVGELLESDDEEEEEEGEESEDEEEHEEGVERTIGSKKIAEDGSDSENDQVQVKKGFQKLSNNPATFKEDDFFDGF